ncbi:MAG: MFS transporter [Acidimicrobiales bacterium]|nr:MFS transporter [Acidimicrobiales bacterium]
MIDTPVVAKEKLSRDVVFFAFIAGLMRCGQNVTLTTYPLLGATLLKMQPSFLGLVASIGGFSTAATMGVISIRLRKLQVAVGLAVGLTFLALSGALFGIAKGGVLFVIASLIGGVGGGLSFPSLTTLTSWSAGKRRSLALAIFSVALGVSLLIGPLVEALLLVSLSHSLRGALFIFSTILFMAALFSSLFMWARRKEFATHLEREEPVAVLEDGPEPIEYLSKKDLSKLESVDPVAQSHSLLSRWNRNGIASSALRYSIINQVAYMVPFIGVASFGGLYIRSSNHIALSSVVLLLSIFYGTSLILRLTVAKLAPLTRPANWCRFGIATSLVGLVVFATLPGMAGIILGLILLGIPHGILYPVTLGVLAEVTPAKDLAKQNSRLAAVANTVPLVVPVVFGQMVRYWGFKGSYLALSVPVLILLIMGWGRGASGIEQTGAQSPSV